LNLIENSLLHLLRWRGVSFLGEAGKFATFGFRFLQDAVYRK